MGGGNFFFICEQKNCHIYNKHIKIGALGDIEFQKGWYVYAGSAKKNLAARVRRHLAKRKTKRWHIDYLRQEALAVKAFPVYTKKDLECPLARDLRDIADGEVENFGSSDCGCPSHLFYFKDYPLYNRRWLDLLFRYRHRLAFD